MTPVLLLPFPWPLVLSGNDESVAGSFLHEAQHHLCKCQRRVLPWILVAITYQLP